MKMYKEGGEENIPQDRPTDTNMKRALKQPDKHPTVEGNFIGFVNEEDETVQFIRFDKNRWLIDVPIR